MSIFGEVADLEADRELQILLVSNRKKYFAVLRFVQILANFIYGRGIHDEFVNLEELVGLVSSVLYTV